MSLHHIEHFLIATDDVEGTRRWWCDILGLVDGPHPDFGFPVHWLYIGDRDVVHICARQGGAEQERYLGATSESGAGTGALDHIAFRCDGLRETLTRFQDLGVEYQDRQVDADALFQVFLRDPNGIKVELNFNPKEAEGIRASVTRADLVDNA